MRSPLNQERGSGLRSPPFACLEVILEFKSDTRPPSPRASGLGPLGPCLKGHSLDCQSGAWTRAPGPPGRPPNWNFSKAPDPIALFRSVGSWPGPLRGDSSCRSSQPGEARRGRPGSQKHRKQQRRFFDQPLQLLASAAACDLNLLLKNP